MNHILALLNKPISKTPIEWFRLGFGLIVLLQVYSFIKVDFVSNFILLPEFNLSWDGLEWIGVLPDPLMKLLPLILFFSGIAILFKASYRVGIITFTICFWYIVLVERSYFNNHLYLLCLIATFLCFYNPHKSDIRAWLLYVLQFHILLVYFYGGTNKLNTDWLFLHEPVRTILSNASDTHQIALHKSDWLVLLLVYGGIIIDLGSSIALLISKTRKYAIYILCAFHLSNHFIFNFGESGDIGVFPFFMIMANCLFIPGEVLEKIRLKYAGTAKKSTRTVQNSSPLPKYGLILVSLYITFECLFPLRHHCIKGDVDWTGVGFHYAWRMKLRTKTTEAKIFARAADQPNETRIQPQGFLNITQWNDAKTNPLVMHQFALKLEKYFKSKGSVDPIIRIELSNGLNGREKQAINDFAMDWTQISVNPMGSNDWILPEKK